MHSKCAIAWLAHRGFAFALIGFGLLVAPPATPIHPRMAEEGRLINNDHLGAGSFLETIFVHCSLCDQVLWCDLLLRASSPL
jgi:hypothetical protein